MRCENGKLFLRDPLQRVPTGFGRYLSRGPGGHTNVSGRFQITVIFEDSMPGAVTRRCSYIIVLQGYFVIENENVPEMDLMPDGEDGLKVTKAVWIFWPISLVSFGM